MKRSICASGSGYVPSDSIGFCVAITRKGSGTGCVSWPIVTWRSCITSSSADCTFAGARLISSASRKLQKTGPSSVSNVPSPRAVDARADEVGRDEVGRELHAREGAAEHAGGRLDRQRLREARNALDQQVALREQADEHALEHRVLPGDDAPDLEQRLLELDLRLLGARRRALGGLGHVPSLLSVSNVNTKARRIGFSATVHESAPGAACTSAPGATSANASPTIPASSSQSIPRSSRTPSHPRCPT